MSLELNGTTGVSLVQDGVVVTADVADSAVTTAKLAAGAAVSNVGAGGITANELATAVQPLGVGQTWQNVAASRAIGTTYTNSTGRPIMVLMTPTASGSLIATITIGGTTFGTVQFTPSGGGGTAPFDFVVPDGTTYSVVNVANTSIGSWFELR